MDKLSIFATDIAVTLASETLDNITDRLDSVVSGQEDVLTQLQVTHLGHEEELWGKEFKAEDLLLDEA